MGHVRQPHRLENALSPFSSLESHPAGHSLNDGPPGHLLKGAFAGKAEAQHRLARFYDEGTSVTPDRATALMWFEKSAGSGYLPSVLRLGQLLLEPGGEMRNRCRGLFFVIKAAHRGSHEACTFLGHARLNGHFLPQSDSLALKWFRQGAGRGCLDSMLGLAFCHMNGRGVDPSVVKAHALLAVATAGSGNGPRVKLQQRMVLDEQALLEVEELAERISRHGISVIDPK
jgi:TPR repeat protein